MHKDWQRPQTAAEVAAMSSDWESFGRNLRDWQHELQKVSSRKAFFSRISEAPSLLQESFDQDRQCDAYLAAYVDWLAAKAAVEAPEWIADPRRVATKAWYDYPPLWKQSLLKAPAAFRKRHIFTQPENPLKIRAGRPSTTASDKRHKNALRQKRHRERVKAKLEKLRLLEKEISEQ